MMCSSYGVFFGFASASFSFVSASEYFFPLTASEASLSVLASSLLTVFFFLSSAANAGLPDITATAPTSAAPMTPAPTTRRTALLFAFMMWFRIVKSLVLELRSIHESDFLHAVALGCGQHLGDVVVLRTTVGAQVNLRLRVLDGLLAEIALELVDVLHNRTVPDHRAVEVHLEVDDLRTLVGRRGRTVLRHVELHRVGHDGQRHDQRDEQHQHHVDQRRGVDVAHHAARRAANTHCHVKLLLMRIVSAAGAYAMVGLREDAHLDHATALNCVKDASHCLELRVTVGANVDFGLR